MSFLMVLYILLKYYNYIMSFLMVLYILFLSFISVISFKTIFDCCFNDK